MEGLMTHAAVGVLPVRSYRLPFLYGSDFPTTD